MNKIIQCPSCNTKFAINETQLIGVENPKFHCSRCDKVFSLDKPEDANSTQDNESSTDATNEKATEADQGNSEKTQKTDLATLISQLQSEAKLTEAPSGEPATDQSKTERTLEHNSEYSSRYTTSDNEISDKHEADTEKPWVSGLEAAEEEQEEHTDYSTKYYKNQDTEAEIEQLLDRSGGETEQLSLFSVSAATIDREPELNELSRHSATAPSIKINPSDTDSPLTALAKLSSEHSSATISTLDKKESEPSDNQSIKVSWESSQSNQAYEVDPLKLKKNIAEDGAATTETTAKELLTSLLNKEKPLLTTDKDSEKNPEKNSEKSPEADAPKSLSDIFLRRKQQSATSTALQMPLVPATDLDTPREVSKTTLPTETHSTETGLIVTGEKDKSVEPINPESISLDSSSAHNRSIRHTTVMKRDELLRQGMSQQDESAYTLEPPSFEEDSMPSGSSNTSNFIETTKRRLGQRFTSAKTRSGQHTELPVYSRRDASTQLSSSKERRGLGVYGSFLMAWLVPGIFMVLLATWSTRLSDTPLHQMNKDSFEYKLSNIIGLTSALNVKLPDPALVLTNAWSRPSASMRFIAIGGWLVNNTQTNYKNITIESSLYDSKNKLVDKVLTELPNELQGKRLDTIPEDEYLNLQEQKKDLDYKVNVGQSMQVIMKLHKDAHWFSTRIYSAHT